MQLLNAWKALTILAVTCSNLPAQVPPEFEDPADYPIMGDWEGQWIHPKRGHEAGNPHLAAQLLPMGNGQYRVALLPELYKRSEPYLDVIVPGTHDRVELNHNGIEVVFEGTKVHGKALLHGLLTEFELMKVSNLSPTLGMRPPKDAIILFDGDSADAWHHQDGRPFSWKVENGVLEVRSGFWNDGKNSAEGIGGMIATRESFGNFFLHLEFRYRVEEGATGQMRGNSGLFLHPVGEVQILNSYLTNGYYDECGAIYRKVPAKVNAAAPPLQWQTYDIALEFLPDREGYCELTVKLNGHVLHNRMVLPAATDEVTILLQDHINRIQFRNIWLVPMD